MTGLNAKTGNYPGVTVARYEGRFEHARQVITIEDLPGTYSLDPISPDEMVVRDTLDLDLAGVDHPDAVLATLDATNLRRSLGLVAQALNTGYRVAVAVTFMDELARRSGSLDLDALRQALSIPVVRVTKGDKTDVENLKKIFLHIDLWARPPFPPSLDPDELNSWIDSIVERCGYKLPERDATTDKVDRFLLHPLWGTLVFFGVVFLLFQAVFTLAAPFQGWIEDFFGWCGDLVTKHLDGWFGDFLSQAIIGGVGGVLVFIPQIAILFVCIVLLEGSGYMTRAAFMLDRVMGRFGMEGRSFMALLSSLACTVPGVMATRSLPSARQRLATIMAAPLMTCSARLPVYLMLVGMLVPEKKLWIFSFQGIALFALYLFGAILAMVTGWLFAKIGGRNAPREPFYMELPPYRFPKLRTMLISVWQNCWDFIRRVSSIILAVTIGVFLLINLPVHSEEQMSVAGVDLDDDVAVAQYQIDNSAAAVLGKAVEPIFEPLGYDWRLNVGVLASLAARESFVATLGQIAAAEDPENPAQALESWTYQDGPRDGEKVFNPATIASLLVFFSIALQCFATLGAIRRETGTWKWALIAYLYMFVLAWVLALAANQITLALV